MRTLLLALPLVAWPGGQEASSEAYPQERPETVMRFFGIKGKVDVTDLNAAAGEAGIEVVQGPNEADSRPGRLFVAVHAPADATAREVARVLKKGGGKVTEMACIAFVGRAEKDQELPSLGLGLSTQDFILGMSSDIWWYDSCAGRTQFYGPVGKLKAGDIQDRYQKLYEPFGGGTIGEVVRDRFTWMLDRELDERDAGKLQKKIAKLDGVASATITGAELAVEVELSSVQASNPRMPFPLPETSEGEKPAAATVQKAEALPRATQATVELFDLLVDEGLLAAPSEG